MKAFLSDRYWRIPPDTTVYDRELALYYLGLDAIKEAEKITDETELNQQPNILTKDEKACLAEALAAFCND